MSNDASLLGAGRSQSRHIWGSSKPYFEAEKSARYVLSPATTSILLCIELAWIRRTHRRPRTGHRQTIVMQVLPVRPRSSCCPLGQWLNPCRPRQCGLKVSNGARRTIRRRPDSAFPRYAKRNFEGDVSTNVTVNRRWPRRLCFAVGHLHDRQAEKSSAVQQGVMREHSLIRYCWLFVR